MNGEEFFDDIWVYFPDTALLLCIVEEESIDCCQIIGKPVVDGRDVSIHKLVEHFADDIDEVGVAEEVRQIVGVEDGKNDVHQHNIVVYRDEPYLYVFAQFE